MQEPLSHTAPLEVLLGTAHLTALIHISIPPLPSLRSNITKQGKSQHVTFELNDLGGLFQSW